MKEKKQSQIVTRAFIETGHDGTIALLEYIDQLEQSVLLGHRKLSKRLRRLPVTHIREAMEGIRNAHS